MIPNYGHPVIKLIPPYAIDTVVHQGADVPEDFRPEDYRVLMFKQPRCYSVLGEGQRVFGKINGFKYRVIAVAQSVRNYDRTLDAIVNYLGHTWKGEKLLVSWAGDGEKWATAVVNVLVDLWTGQFGLERPGLDRTIYSKLARRLIGDREYLSWKELGIGDWDFYTRKGFVCSGSSGERLAEACDVVDTSQEIVVSSLEEFYQARPYARVNSVEVTGYGVKVNFSELEHVKSTENKTRAEKLKPKKPERYGVGALVCGKILYLKSGGGVTFEVGQVAVFDRDTATIKARNMTRNSRNGYKWKERKL